MTKAQQISLSLVDEDREHKNLKVCVRGSAAKAAIAVLPKLKMIVNFDGWGARLGRKNGKGNAPGVIAVLR